MSNTAIKVENLSKIYRLGEIGTGTISRDLERWVKMKVMGKEDPFLKIGESNDRSKKGSSDIVYSLKDINFEIQQGDAVGIIGRNGAGKSTLLKILSRVTTPTTGKINIKGRVASLLEVGTGFHPELTGRENIYLNGAILGMRKKEIDRKFDEIVDFSGVERYIDTPVKRYSSGMYVRLAFAVAAHLESEILIVDEVLAVGDAEFQKKCLGKMGEVSKGDGRTVLFVSHNMAAVNLLCNKAISLQFGNLIENGSVFNVINNYININTDVGSSIEINKKVSEIILRSGKILNFKNENINIINFNESWKIQIEFEVVNKIENIIFGFGITSNSEVAINTSWGDLINFDKGFYKFDFLISDFPLQAGKYNIVFGITKDKTSIYYNDQFLSLQVEFKKNINQIIKADGTTGFLAKQFINTIEKYGY
jgi:ABC-type polysaccharide/polyol phosphate transport system ATPase subunit